MMNNKRPIITIKDLLLFNSCWCQIAWCENMFGSHSSKRVCSRESERWDSFGSHPQFTILPSLEC